MYQAVLIEPGGLVNGPGMGVNLFGAVRPTRAGYRDQEFFRLRIYSIHLAKYVLLG
jgi:hypothetical protein